MPKILLYGAVVAAAVAAGCGSADTVTVTEKVASVPLTRTATTPVRHRPHALPGLGEALTLPASYTTDAELAITPLEVEYAAPEPSPPVVKLRSGFHWVRVKLRAVNRSHAAADQTAISYLLVDGDGTRFEADPTNLYEPHMNCCGTGYAGSTMAPGDRAVGYVGFQVPNGRRPERLRAITSPAATEPTILEWQIG